MNHLINKTESSPKRRFCRNIWLVWIIFAAGMLATAVAACYVRINVEADATHKFDSSCNEIKLKIEARLNAHARILRSGAAFFDASDNNVMREKWHIFILRQRVEQQLPGIQGTGFSLLIPREHLAQHEEEIRSQGFPQYNVRPEGRRDIYTSIIYLEPFEGRNLRAFGYDMFSDPVRRAAMELSRDTDAAVLSGRVILVQETEKEVQAGVLMYVPVYIKGMPTDTIKQRRSAIYGWVYSPYRMNDLMHGISGASDEQKGLRLKVFDGERLSPDTLLYDSQTGYETQLDQDKESDSISPLTLHTPRLNTQIDSAGRIWSLSFRRGWQAPSTDLTRILAVIFGGTLTAFFFPC